MNLDMKIMEGSIVGAGTLETKFVVQAFEKYKQRKSKTRELNSSVGNEHGKRSPSPSGVNPNFPRGNLRKWYIKWRMIQYHHTRKERIERNQILKQCIQGTDSQEAEFNTEASVHEVEMTSATPVKKLGGTLDLDQQFLQKAFESYKQRRQSSVSAGPKAQPGNPRKWFVKYQNNANFSSFNAVSSELEATLHEEKEMKS